MPFVIGHRSTACRFLHRVADTGLHREAYRPFGAAQRRRLLHRLNAALPSKPTQDEADCFQAPDAGYAPLDATPPLPSRRKRR